MPEMFDDLTCLVVFHQPRHEKICSSNWESSSPGIGMKIKKTFELPPTSWWLGSWALGRFFLPKWADKSLHRSFDSEWLCELFLLTACCRVWSISICFFHFQGWLCIQSLFHQWKLTAGTQKWSFGSDEFPLYFGLFAGSMYPPIRKNACGVVVGFGVGDVTWGGWFCFATFDGVSWRIKKEVKIQSWFFMVKTWCSSDQSMISTLPTWMLLNQWTKCSTNSFI